ncbi:MAG TPA: hypothetical protein VM529_04715 [Gemmata sp.]|nr:hypothetical protein [Gemmata sp.]
MTVRLTALAALVSLVALTARAQDHPFKTAAKDDTATYKMKVAVGTLVLEGTTTQTVVAKTDTKVTVRVTANFSGMEPPPQDQEIDLTKTYDPTRVGALPQGAEAKLDKLKDGKEKIKVAGKEYETTWTTYKMKAKAGGMDIDADLKVWMSKDVPMGMAKMEMKAEFAGQAMNMTMELTETGNKPVKD